MAKQAEDTKTADMLAQKKRGRPRLHEDQAARQKAYRERKGLKTLSIELPATLYDDFEAWVARRALDEDTSKAQVIQKLLRTQLLRKR